MNLRGFEKSEKFGYIFIVSYDGKKFDSFDEMMGKKTIKGEFKKELLNLNFTKICVIIFLFKNCETTYQP